MVEHWWQRLFRLDDDAQIQGSEQGDPSAAAPVGRFKDTNRHVEVKMLAKYPEHSTQAERKSVKNKNANEFIPDQEQHAAHLRKKAPFRLTKVPSPVFGYHRPSETIKSKKPDPSFYLNNDKEEQEKRQIHDRKKDEQLRPTELPHSADPPVLDRQITDQPAVSRKKEACHDDANEKMPVHQKTVGHEAHTLSKKAVHSEQMETGRINESRSFEDDAEKERRSSQENGKTEPKQNHHEILRVSSRLPRSPHRHEAQSKIPFNVLMFHSDRKPKQATASDPTAEPRRAGELQLPLKLLNDSEQSEKDSDSWISDKKETLVETLENFHVDADVIGYVQGPSVTRFDLHLHPGVKINKVLSLNEDIKLSLAARQIRIAPVPGTSAVGIEIPNKVRRPVLLKELLASTEYIKSRAPLTAALGQDVSGNQVFTDLAKMPHGLIAGATGSGKSVCIHSLILSLIYRTSPEELRFLLIDPKVVELAPYQEIPHLAAPVITEPKEAAAALKWAVEEMEQRYRLFADNAVRDMDGYNRKVHSGDASGEKLPYIVIIIDELADLMMVAPQDVEESVCRIAQKARAAGIHLLVATQRPSVDVITGLIKSNIPTRIAFSVSSQTDSRTILDCGGAERLLGRGDLLFAENGSRSLRRLQACYVSDEEINRVTHAFQNDPKPGYLFSPETVRTDYERSEQEDELLSEAAEFVVSQGQASVSAIQRHFRVGYNRAARLVDELEMRSIISANNGSKPRQVLVSKEKLKERLSENELEQF
ncbi:DNA translocase FtsK [Sporolactobacillus shoreicorticis]|uniref:DNA translocase FtsK n=1 Tax=Sporolactobacillus shoreicorticis TaxID=1923877 RepID=A0ABW5RY13_9BACL|nr:DNA translocase FtsK [Sporolactobacillus shoreicorticis]MCO7124883.1 DNA translocase FtsK [Sporolactobacillus shoreicorticis]